MEEGNYIPDFEPRGDFDFIKLTQRNCKSGYLYRYLVQERSKEEKPRAFIEQCTIVKGVTGTASSRKWISIAGNVSGIVAIPTHMLKDDIAVEFFSPIASMAIKEVGNMYAPGEYCTKFPNDVVCCKHGKKTCGILCRKEGKFVVAVFGFNLIEAPKDEQLRAQGLRACCLKNHSNNIPTPEEFIYQCGVKILEVYKQLDTLDKILNMMNLELNVFEKKKFKIVMNNPNAEIYKDGVLWTPDHPNALTKGYLNGDDYIFLPYFFDVAYYENATNSNEEKEADKRTREYKEQKEKERKEKEGTK